MAKGTLLCIPLASLLWMGPTVNAQDAGPNGQQQPAPPPAEAPSAASVGSSTVPEAVDPTSYIIGAEDMLLIDVWREPNFTRSVYVRPDGKFAMPLVQDVQAEGLTPERLGEQLEQALAEYIQTPEVTVSVLQVNSKKYTVAGLVNRPAVYPMPSPVTVFEAINAAGGFQQWANQKDIVILRGEERLKFNYSDFIKGKNTDGNILLQNGDTVYVK